MWVWWDDAIAMARLLARETGQRQRVTANPDGPGWVIEPQTVSEVCS